jgi:hypothetical protein
MKATPEYSAPNIALSPRQLFRATHQPADRKLPVMAENSLFRTEQGIAHSALELRRK